ncbi:MAG: ExbD/TolR family protein, partial [Isosphaeraceae bacterium]
AAEKQATTQPAVPGRSSEAHSRRVESRTVAGPHDGWEPSQDDLDLDVIEGSRSSCVALPVVHSRDRDGTVLPAEADEQPETEFSLSRSATQKIEELDLAPMVDVAFQLVLFFMVTATTILYKTLEIPKPSGEAPAGTVAQGRSRSLDDLKDDYILVEIDDRGAMKLDRQPIEPVRETLVENLRRAREKTGRKSMLLSADFATLHRNAVLAYDAAIEIGLSIAIAKPQSPQGPAPSLRAAPAAAPRPVPNSSAAPATPF